MKHMSPKHFVIHPSTGTILTTGSDFAARKAQSRKSLRELQTHIASCNSTYGLSTILCVENCPRSVAYDAETTLALLSGEGLEQVRVCLDTGHALIPLNGSYINPTKTATPSPYSESSAHASARCTSSRIPAPKGNRARWTSICSLTPAV